MTVADKKLSTLRVSNAAAAPWGHALLRDINFQLEPGAVLAIAGPNGAGKSTLLRLICGEVRPDSGAVEFSGRRLSDWPIGEVARSLAILPQMSLLNFPYTVEEVVLLGRIPHASGLARDLEIAAAAMRATDTLALRERLYTQLSGGEKQRTQLARVFAQLSGDDSLAGRLLLLDEPTSALDLAHQQQVLTAVRKLSGAGCAVVLVIHDLNIAASIADRILVLDGGRQVACGTPESVLTRELFREVFHVDVDITAHPLHSFPVITPCYAALP